MIEFLDNIDKKIFLFLNGIHFDWLDPIMQVITSHFFWIPAILFFIICSILCFKKRFWVPIVFVAVAFALTDAGSTFTKKNIKRPRPSRNIELVEKIHLVNNYKGGDYGFFSGHAANSLGLALLSLLFIRKKFYTIPILLWSFLVSYSRIYMGVHYPFDILCGFLYGTIIAFLFYNIATKLFYKYIFTKK